MKLLKKEIIKNRIHKERIKQGLTQAQLAKQSGVTPAAICQIEKGERTPTIPVLYRIAQILQVSLDYLAGQKDSIELKDALQNRDFAVFYRKYKDLSKEDKEFLDKYVHAKSEQK